MTNVIFVCLIWDPNIEKLKMTSEEYLTLLDEMSYENILIFLDNIGHDKFNFEMSFMESKH